MGNNTKFVGFLPHNKIELERWGTSTTVELDEPSILALRDACFNRLPKKPLQPKSSHADEFFAQYDSGVGRVQLSLDPATATYLADLMDVLVKDNIPAMEKVKPWVEKLQAAVQAHKDYHDISNEPGLTQ